MNGFDLATIQADIIIFKSIFQEFAKTIPADAWARKTGSRDKDWTLHETMAHLVVIAQAFNRAGYAASNQHELLVTGVSQRSDLRDWNDAEIASRRTRPHYALVAEFTSELDRTVEYLQTLPPEQLAFKTLLKVYNRPASALYYFGWQLSHAGIIHAAQVTRPVDVDPLWTQYPADMLLRQVDRFIAHFSIAYWQDYGPANAEIINIHIGDRAWHLIAAPDGGSSGQGALDNPQHVLKFSDPKDFFGIFTGHLAMTDALTNGKLQVEGDFRQTMSLMRLFSATPPT